MLRIKNYSYVSFARDKDATCHESEKKKTVSSVFPTKKHILARANATLAIRKTRTSPPSTKSVVSFLKPAQTSSKSEISYVEKDEGNVDVFQAV